MTATDNALEILSVLAIAGIWVLLLLFYSNLPEKIPVHFNSAGQIDGYGSKLTLIFEPLIASILYIGLTFLNKHPHLFNYLSPITPENAEYQYRMATRLIRYIKLIIVLLFAFIMWTSIQAATSYNDGFGIKFLPVFLALIIIPSLFVLAKSLNRKKQNS